VKKIDLSTLGVDPDLVGETGQKVKILRYAPPPQRSEVKMVEGDFPENLEQLIKLLREEAKAL
ncbi:MAG: electron transfer flavoprotein subunit beta, partial [Proteobacteria bacterium]|nr:electron transfer flavoprotein subunit beta [Pseudomonadota bacterium]